VDNITLISGALKTCKVVGEIARTTDTEDSAHIKPSFLQTRADILVTDLIDFRLHTSFVMTSHKHALVLNGELFF
jgi:hypothetical protein